MDKKDGQSRDLCRRQTLSDEQNQAVCFDKGVMELVAGPGSGKTFVLTNRIKTLIRKYNVRADSILVITFTRAAAIEMRDRFYGLMDNESSDDECRAAFGTFHSVFYQMIKTCPEMKKCSLISESARLKLIAEMLRQSGEYRPAEDMDMILSVSGLISRIKNDGADGDFDVYCKAAADNGFMTEPAVLENIYSSYEQYMSENNRIDFDDMILKCRDKLLSDEGFRKKWQERFKYIIIDEFQDICSLQYQVVKILASPEDNIFAVGDDDQSIYGFRGANPSIMRSLISDYPSAVRLTLGRNYRSTKSIVDAAGLIISANKDRIEKRIFSNGDIGEKVSYVECRGREDELQNLSKLIKRRGADSCAVLCRKNRECREVAEYLLGMHVTFRIKNKLRDPLQDEALKDLMAYMSFIYGKRDRRTFFMIMNRPVRYIKRSSVRKEIVDSADMADFYEGNIEMQEKIKKLFFDIDRMKEMRPFLAVNFIRKVMGYDKWYIGEHTSDQRETYIKRADGFQNAAKRCGSFDKLQEYYDDCRKDFENKSRENSENEMHGVKIMTYHGSKGLEFDSVFLPFINEGEVPPRQCSTNEGIEEERRMFYVALTRAKKDLTILYSRTEQDRPSMFISKLI